MENSNPLQAGLKLLNHCPLCHGQCAEKDAEIIVEKPSARLLHITCSHCRHGILAVVAASPLGVSSIGMTTDLSVQDARRLLFKKPISEDELLDFHQILKTNQFNFKNL